MNKLFTCVFIEFKKLFRSKVPLITTLALTMVPFMGGFFMFILKDPNLAESLGFISAKAHIIGTADWGSYMDLISQAISIGGLLVFGFITSWIFGREYADRTIKDLLAIPVSRSLIVFSKFIVATIWPFMLSIYVLILSLIIGMVIGMPGFTSSLLIDGVFIYMICSILTMLLSTPVGLFASAGRGYLSPLGFVIFTLVLAQIIAATGYGMYFPWAIPAIIAGIAGKFGIIEHSSILIVLFTSLIGIISTILWWRFAEQH